MTGYLVDPTDVNVAILIDGRLSYAMRFVPLLADVSAPIAAEVLAQPIIGYAAAADTEFRP